MPTIVIRYSTSGGGPLATAVRGMLAGKLIKALPEMMVRALAPVSDLKANQMTIDLQPYDVHAYNVAALCIEVWLSPGEQGKVYTSHELICRSLQRSVMQWLEQVEPREQVSEEVLKGGIDINLLFAPSAGVCFDGITGGIKSAWPRVVGDS